MQKDRHCCSEETRRARLVDAQPGEWEEVTAACKRACTGRLHSGETGQTAGTGHEHKWAGIDHAHVLGGGRNALRARRQRESHPARTGCIALRQAEQRAVRHLRSVNFQGGAPCGASALRWKCRAEGGADNDGIAGGVQSVAWGGDGAVPEPAEVRCCREARSKIRDGEVNCGSSTHEGGEGIEWTHFMRLEDVAQQESARSDEAAGGGKEQGRLTADDVNVTSVNNRTDWEARLTAHRAPSIEAVRRANGGRGSRTVSRDQAMLFQFTKCSRKEEIGLGGRFSMAAQLKKLADSKKVISSLRQQLELNEQGVSKMKESMRHGSVGCQRGMLQEESVRFGVVS
ncbi:hypothetical protein C8R45DRAFT_1073424 [Mycena sanguinolenta]|nr:hypothetical protein C8R45DRAFT_1073424 [Mycena sanguinolenta]